jgi:hypothetical protein
MWQLRGADPVRQVAKEIDVRGVFKAKPNVGLGEGFVHVGEAKDNLVCRPLEALKVVSKLREQDVAVPTELDRAHQCAGEN